MPPNDSWPPIPSRTTRRSRAGSCGPSPDRAGNLLEVVVLLLDDTDLIIHAMRMRSKYSDLLP